MKLTQKYTIVQLIEALPDGFEYKMEDWPLHITLADVFEVKGDSKDILRALEKIKLEKTIRVKVVGEKLFGENNEIRVKLLENTDALQKLHHQIVTALEGLAVQFNTPEFTSNGFLPHSTVLKAGELETGQQVTFDSLTLIDMFPDGNGYMRRVVSSHPLI